MSSLTDLREVVDVVVGVDTHVHTHSAAVVEVRTGGVLKVPRRTSGTGGRTVQEQRGACGRPTAVRAGVTSGAPPNGWLVIAVRRAAELGWPKVPAGVERRLQPLGESGVHRAGTRRFAIASSITSGRPRGIAVGLTRGAARGGRASRRSCARAARAGRTGHKGTRGARKLNERALNDMLREISARFAGATL